ncbi:MAG TPA: helix-turn-helix transcriptional regulator, partial [Treponemataceae bacterium]|nr:helix-turn-helix transcriptional regulator [Treponemataceae bacterium]
FKLSYICFSIFTINVYFFFSRYYFRVYEPDPASLIISPDLLKKYDISEREKEIISLLLQGKSNIEIGNSLFISVNTVKSHLKNIYKKMSLKNRLQLVSLIHSSQNSS